MRHVETLGSGEQRRPELPLLSKQSRLSGQSSPVKGGRTEGTLVQPPRAFTTSQGGQLRCAACSYYRGDGGAGKNSQGKQVLHQEPGAVRENHPGTARRTGKPHCC